MSDEKNQPPEGICDFWSTLDVPSREKNPHVKEASCVNWREEGSKTLEGGNDGAQFVHPGDWIATGIQGEHWPIKPDIFAATYEPVT